MDNVAKCYDVTVSICSPVYGFCWFSCLALEGLRRVFGKAERKGGEGKRCKGALLPTGNGLWHMWKHTAPLGAEEGGEPSRETPRSCGEKGVIILSYSITVMTRTHKCTHGQPSAHNNGCVQTHEKLIYDRCGSPHARKRTPPCTPVFLWRQTPLVEPCGGCHFLH